MAKLHQLDEAIRVLSAGIATNPNHRPQQDELERLAEQKWRDLHAKLMTRVDMLDRESLINEPTLTRLTCIERTCLFTVICRKAPQTICPHCRPWAI